MNTKVTYTGLALVMTGLISLGGCSGMSRQEKNTELEKPF